MRLWRLTNPHTRPSQLVFFRHSHSQPEAASVLGCNVYISEGRREDSVQQLKETALAQQGVALVKLFVDHPYNRTNFTFASDDPHQLSQAVVNLARCALELVDLRQHSASHPRTGVVDHIACHALTPGTPPEQAVQVAKAIGRALGRGNEGVPVLLYGAANAQGRRLADIRRRLGYFRGASAGQWAGGLQPEGDINPDYGPARVSARSGVALVGAGPWVTNYNVPVRSDDLAAGRKLAQELGERGGGLPALQAMALPHEQGFEVACNLLDVTVSPVSRVLQRIQELAAAAGLQLGQPYLLNDMPAQLAEKALTMLKKQQDR